MKKTLSFILSLLLCLALCACGGSEPAPTPAPTPEPTPEHIHAGEGDWDRDAKGHWQYCACGEKANVGAHKLTDEVCTVCGSEVWDYGDMIDVNTVSADGTVMQSTSYDADGNVLSDTKWIYKYDSEGNITKETVFMDGVLTEETEYTTDSEGEIIPTGYVYYNSDGSYYVGKYDEHGNVYSLTDYDANGTLCFESLSEYAMDENGESYEIKCTENHYAEGFSFICEYNEYGDAVSRVKTDLEGNVESSQTWEREYNEEGYKLWEKQYSGDKLIYEIVGYTEYEDETSWSRFPTKTIDYLEDGSRVEYENDERGNPAKETYYMADGSVDYTDTFEYEYDSEGFYTATRAYRNNTLINECSYAAHPDGWTYKANETKYFEDGSKTVTEYDENEEPVSSIIYDADGNEVA